MESNNHHGLTINKTLMTKIDVERKKGVGGVGDIVDDAAAD